MEAGATPASAIFFFFFFFFFFFRCGKVKSAPAVRRDYDGEKTLRRGVSQKTFGLRAPKITNTQTIVKGCMKNHINEYTAADVVYVIIIGVRDSISHSTDNCAVQLRVLDFIT